MTQNKEKRVLKNEKELLEVKTITEMKKKKKTQSKVRLMKFLLPLKT